MLTKHSLADLWILILLLASSGRPIESDLGLSVSHNYSVRKLEPHDRIVPDLGLSSSQNCSSSDRLTQVIVTD